MALNIKNLEVERLADQVAKMTGETKTEAIRRALKERMRRLSYRVIEGERKAKLSRFLENEIWPAIPKKHLGKGLKREEEDRVLGYGEDGV